MERERDTPELRDRLRKFKTMPMARAA